jgi:hypothetical protein
VARLPGRTRAAMLRALGQDRIIAGAYTDGRDGACPLLAAHRRGGRSSTDGFPSAWDAYTRASWRPRHASAREVDELRAMLRESFLATEFDIAPAEPAPASAVRPITPEDVTVARPAAADVRQTTLPRSVVGAASPNERGRGRFRSRPRVRAVVERLEDRGLGALATPSLAGVPVALGALSLVRRAALDRRS